MTGARDSSASGGPFGDYLRRELRGNPRGLAIATVGLGLLLWGLVAGETEAVITGVGMLMLLSAVIIAAAWFGRQSDLRHGRAFSHVRPSAPEPGPSGDQQLTDLRARREQIEAELDRLRRDS